MRKPEWLELRKTGNPEAQQSGNQKAGWDGDKSPGIESVRLAACRQWRQDELGQVVVYGLRIDDTADYHSRMDLNNDCPWSDAVTDLCMH